MSVDTALKYRNICEHPPSQTLMMDIIHFATDDVFLVNRMPADWPLYFALFTATKIY